MKAGWKQRETATILAAKYATDRPKYFDAEGLAALLDAVRTGKTAYGIAPLSEKPGIS
ncbi:MAG: hypothetical protein ACRD2E_09550 [Terriglobales bacterium]